MENSQPPTRSIRRQLIVAIAMPLLILLTLATGLAWQVRVLLNDAKWVEHTDEVLANGNALQTEILNMQTGARGFLLTRDAAFLPPFRQGEQALSGRLDQLQALTADNPRQIERLQLLRRVLDHWRQRARTMLEADRTTLLPLLQESEQQMREIRSIMGDFLQMETSLQHQRVAQVGRTKISAVLFSGLSVLLAAMVVAFVTQRQLLSVSREYDRALDTERKAVQLRDVFLSVASHELRTPLTSLKLQAERLERLLPAQGESSKVSKSLDVIHRQTGRMEKLVAQLFDVSQLSHGPIALEWSTVDLSAVLRECVADLQEDARITGHELVVEAPDSLVGDVDLLRFRQIVANLISNALKFGAQKPIHVALVPRNDRVRLIVEDQGIGIAHADQERIFQPFEQAVSSMNYGGFGIGLWLVRAFAQAMRGTVTVCSMPGEGATFTVELPIHHVEGDTEGRRRAGRVRASDPAVPI